jgi:hypothetical protein
MVITALATLAGCVWENTVYTAGKLPQYARLSDHLDVQNPPRFLVSDGASIKVTSVTDGRQSWVTAANRGVHAVYPNPSSSRDYTLNVVWPEVTEASEPVRSYEFDLGLLGFYEVPKASQQRTLNVHLHSPAGEPIHTMQLVLRPQLWGGDWNTEAVLEAGFAKLAQTLKGT